MAVVNVDLSEYDAIRKRNSELEEQVKELKKLNDSLKQGAKVILRKETVVEYNEIEENPYRQIRGIGGLGEICNPKNVRRIIESSESYVNFEDVRLKVENAMQDEVKRSIHDRDCERQAYARDRDGLEKVYDGMKADLKKTYEKKEKDLEEKYARMTGNFEAERLRILNKLPKIASVATDLRDELTKIRFFKPRMAIKLADEIIGYATKKEGGTWTD